MGTPLPDRDDSARLLDAVAAAHASGTALYINGGGSKRHLIGRPCAATALETTAHRGVVSYRPEELVLTARAGTPISDLLAITAAQGQCLPFEPASFGGAATLGGTLASGLSGPARPWRGSMRDAVLGVRLINGRGEHLRFGGEVMKNVAGYDVSRLQAGALGTLGLITEVSLRLLPTPAAELYLERPATAVAALQTMREIAALPYPLSGACWSAGTLHLRFAGTAPALQAVQHRLGEFHPADGSCWSALREWSPYADMAAFWGLDLAPATSLDTAAEPLLIDWAGARRLYPGTLAADAAKAMATRGRGHATRYGAGDDAEAVMVEPPAALRALQTRIKQALDPRGIFNPGRLHSWL